MPTGCKSEYLESKSQQRVLPRGIRRQCAPACDLERGTEDLGSHEFRHDEDEEAKSAAARRNFFEGRDCRSSKANTEGGKGYVWQADGVGKGLFR